MVASRAFLAEVMKALGVLALVFLSFGHAAPSPAAGYEDQAGWFCGASGEELPLSHDKPRCDACRIAAALAPCPPVDGVVEITQAAVTSARVVFDTVAAGDAAHRADRARAPPALI